MRPKLYVATGAYDCGKTTTLEFLRDSYGYIINKEAARSVLEELGGKKLGHQFDKTLQKILSEDHICPVCTPLEFTELVFKKQKELEYNAKERSFIDRGYLDIVEFFLRSSNLNEFSLNYKKEEFGSYLSIFLFDVMPNTQVPKWGKSIEKRTEEAIRINRRLFDMYTAEGFKVYKIPPEPIENRAEMIHEIISK